MIYHDDELLEHTEGQEVSLDQLNGDMVVRTIYKPEAPMEAVSEFKVLLELKGVGSKNGRLGVDLVTVLDISGSMAGERIDKMKIAMRFLLKKLGHTDRLSVVTFNRKAARLCPLLQIKEASRKEIETLVNGLEARSTTNTEAGLRMAIDILNDRTLIEGRRAAIMLLSDGMEDEESHAADFPADKVPIYTFGLDCDFDPKLLFDIAKKSQGGMFAAVSKVENLTAAFSLSLAGLLNVAIEDLTLTITPSNDYKITEVKAGIYHQQMVCKYDNPVTITFGSLYDREIRKVLVKLTLPEVTKQSRNDIFKFAYKYSVGGKNTKLESKTESIHVNRNDTPTEAENEEVIAEEKRIRTARKMKDARLSADKKELEEAREFLVSAKILLSEVDAILIAQLDQLFHFMVSQETYDIKGRAFALALEESHEAQRATTFTSDNAFKVRMFNTPLMDQYIEQADSFNGNYDYEVPTEEEDRQKVALVY
ncbi:hypothetical protein C5167_041277 [Papaver somniferum]|uniref:VWFA domain-containing protein n=1 Tax=Papaver somniferum TaxID=3469 RepID=A0A4Y7IHG5_PAPSO|nr:E3 ubiquitin-protein ligase WAV3-like [Papaver somniferum]RZC48324.1 hypothetical protein C5167_041277 [Papaver somniferum]